MTTGRRACIKTVLLPRKTSSPLDANKLEAVAMASQRSTVARINNGPCTKTTNDESENEDVELGGGRDVL